eukprot:g21623.t1
MAPRFLRKRRRISVAWERQMTNSRIPPIPAVLMRHPHDAVWTPAPDQSGGSSGGNCDNIQGNQVMTVYHQTGCDIGPLILKEGFHLGKVGWCGGGVYFAMSPKATVTKAIGPDSHKGFMIEAQVRVGNIAHGDDQCVMNGKHLNAGSVHGQGLDSLEAWPGRSAFGAAHFMAKIPKDGGFEDTGGYPHGLDVLPEIQPLAEGRGQRHSEESMSGRGGPPETGAELHSDEARSRGTEGPRSLSRTPVRFPPCSVRGECVCVMAEIMEMKVSTKKDLGFFLRAARAAKAKAAGSGADAAKALRPKAAAAQKAAPRSLGEEDLQDLAVYAEEVSEASYLTNHKGSAVAWPAVNLYVINDHFVKPFTLPFKCSWVELVSAGPQPPTWFVSHCGQLRETPFVKAILSPRCQGTVALLDSEVTTFDRSAKVHDHLYDIACWLPANSALHGGKAVPAKPTLRMDTGEGAKVSWRERCGVDELGKRPKRNTRVRKMFAPGALYKAALHNEVPELSKLLTEFPEAKDEGISDGAGPVYAAAMKNHTDALKVLLDAGAQVDKAKHDGATAVFIATQFGSTDALMLGTGGGALNGQMGCG